MSWDLFCHWKAYAAMKPFGKENKLLADIACLIYNSHRGENPPVDTDVFLPVQRSEAEQLKRDEARMLTEMRK